MAALYLEKVKDRPALAVTFLVPEIQEWAEAPEIGNLSHESAHAFAVWVEDVHHDRTYEETLTTGELLRLCLERWIGGRPI